MLFYRSQIVQDGGVKFVRDSRKSLDVNGIDPDARLLGALLQGRDFGIGLDIGANAGIWSLYLAKYSCQIYAFEPDPEVRTLLENNLKLNEDIARKIEISEFAVSDESGMRNLHIRRALDGSGRVNNGISSLVRDFSFVKHLVPVATISLDEFTHSKSVPITWIKIDVEGNELNVLRGAQKTLLSSPFVVWEMLFDHAQNKESQLLRIAEEFPDSYSHFVPKEGRLAKIEKSLISNMADTNIFSLPDSWSNLWTQYVAS
jgi:FkbM family methyltransferase